MSNPEKVGRTDRQSFFPILGPLVALVFAFGLVQLLAASNSEVATVFDGSSKSASSYGVLPGEVITYTIQISHTGTSTAAGVMITDTLPTELSYNAASLTITPDVGSDPMENGGVITWSGDISPDTEFTIQYAATVTDNVATGEIITNTAFIDNQGTVIERDAPIEIIGPLDGSLKSVSSPETLPGDVITYTIQISHTGVAEATGVLITDTLPAELTYVADTLTMTPTVGSPPVENDGVITWMGNIPVDTAFSIQYATTVADTVGNGEIITNTVFIDSQGTIISRSIPTRAQKNYYLPLFFKPAAGPELFATRPTSSNTWTMSWTTDQSGVVEYEIEEAQNADFTDSTVSTVSGTSLDVSKQAGFNNGYYYRVRTIDGDGLPSFWSNTVKVVGNYLDNFDDESSNWEMRRTTYIEETNAYYNGKGEFIIIVGDRWDWLIASPLKEAPALPYVIEYRARVHDASNLVSGGLIMGGDWGGGECPESGNVYQSTNCFNRFYNFNFIFYGPMKLLHEQVNSLVWCRSCAGSPMKRLGPTDGVDPILNNGPSLDWNNYRFEVRENGVRFFINGNFRAEFNDTSYLNQPYFGVFASTDEYKPSIWFFDYFKVTALD